MNCDSQFCRLGLLATFSILLLFAGCTSITSKSGSVGDWDAIADRINASPNPEISKKELANETDVLKADQKLDGNGSGQTTKYIGDAVVDSYRRLTNDLTSTSEAQELFKEGLDLFEAKKYDKAAGKFHSCQWKCKDNDSILKEDALFMEAESYFFDNNYRKAYKKYNKLTKQYQNSRYADRMAAREFALARYWENLYDKYQYNFMVPNFFDKKRPVFDTNGEARKAFSAVQMQNVNGTFADASVMASGNNFFRVGRFTEASEQYDMLCENYPNSKYAMRAYLLNLECKLQMYSGPHYDSKPLEDAEKIAKHLTNFYGPALPPEMKSEIQELLVYIEEEKAERDLAIAEYYAEKKYYGAARRYYVYVQKDHPGTKAAATAKEEYPKIASLPNEPKDHFEWVKIIFPED